MTWNYRVMKEDEGWSGLRFIEAYYDEGSDTPHSYCELLLAGGDIKQLEDQLEKLKSALTKPILNSKDF